MISNDSKTLMIYFFRFFRFLSDFVRFLSVCSKRKWMESSQQRRIWTHVCGKTACNLNNSIWKFDKSFVTLNKSVIICPNLFLNSIFYSHGQLGLKRYFLLENINNLNFIVLILNWYVTNVCERLIRIINQSNQKYLP